MRTRLGSRAFYKRDTVRQMIKHKEEVSITAFVADQTPPVEGAYWTNFLNQDTPFYTGPVRLAKRFDRPIVYASVIPQHKRGYYYIRLKVLSHSPKEQTIPQLMDSFIQSLEKDIVERPQYWLWSHKRWKHKRGQSA